VSDTPEDQAKRRALRRQLGLCWHCLEPASPGHTTCATHRALNKRNQRRYLEREQKARGWVMKRVKI